MRFVSQEIALQIDAVLPWPSTFFFFHLQSIAAMALCRETYCSPAELAVISSPSRVCLARPHLSCTFVTHQSSEGIMCSYRTVSRVYLMLFLRKCSVDYKYTWMKYCILSTLRFLKGCSTLLPLIYARVCCTSLISSWVCSWGLSLCMDAMVCLSRER